MKKILIVLCAYLTVALMPFGSIADESRPNADEKKLENYISSIYKHLDFHNSDRLSYDVFQKAYKGYLNLRNAGKLSYDREILTVCDMNLPSSENRLWVIDLANGKIVFNTYVAHGQGSGDECAESFSNSFNSHQTSLGFYVTGETYNGDHGLSLRLNGMDNGYNDAAIDRGIVVHGACYVSEQYIAGNARLGRSWGCPAVPDKLKVPIINAIQGGTCLFIYYQDNDYLKAAYWLNKTPEIPQQNSMYDELLMMQKALKNKK